VPWPVSEEQESYREALRGWLADVAPPGTVRAWLDAGDATEFERRFAGGGWAGVGLPENLGGQGGGLTELALTAEELARAAALSAAWLATVLAAPALAGRPALVAAALGGETAALLIPAEAVPDCVPGLAVDGSGAVTGSVPRVLDRTRSAADVVLDRAGSQPLPADADALLRDASARAAVLVAADSLGAAGRMLDLAVQYSTQRHQFGVPIGSFQAVKHAAATILVGVEAARSAVYFAAASVDAGDPQALLHAAAAKAQVTADGARAADGALTMHGAIGYTWEHDLQLFYKRAKLDEQLYGPPAAWNDLIADGLALA
jgi:alkylation response protein AidB-like acyl-CoA dehydrogenase